MDNLLNLFPISNQNHLNLSYRLVEISGLSEGKTLYHNLQKIKHFVGREYGTPAVHFRQDGRFMLAIAEQTKKNAFPPEIDVSVLQGFAVRLRLLPDEPVQLNIADLRDIDQAVAETFIGFALRSYLYGHPQLWMGGSAFLWYRKQQMALQRIPQWCPSVELYPGFSYRAVLVPGVGLCVAVDVVHAYTDSRTLAERMASGEDWRDLVGRHFVYEFGPQWYVIQLRQVCDFSITASQSRFEYPRSSGKIVDVYNHTLERNRGQETARLLRLTPNDRALIYNYPNQSDEWSGAVTLARLKYRTEDPGIGKLHDLTILAPDERLARIKDIISEYLDGRVLVKGVAVNVSQEPLSVPDKSFPVPAQLFGGDRILKPPRQGKDELTEMWRTRKRWLQNEKIGPLEKGAIQNQFILAPLSLAADEALMDRVRSDLVNEVKKIGATDYEPTPVIWDDREARTIPQIKLAISELQPLMERAGTACALVILPNTMAGKVRRHIKKMLYPTVRTKCVRADKLLSHLEEQNGEYQVIDHKYWSYLRYTALDLLVTSGYRFWALAEPMHYDLYVGIDVLNNTAGFTFVGLGGAICRFHSSVSQQKEKLAADQVAQELETHIADFAERISKESGALPRHLVIHRDGRFYSSEQKGLDFAVKRLCGRMLLPHDIQVGVVEIHKSHAKRLRMFGDLRGRAVNPWVGSYHILDEHWGVLCTTGFPALRRGTANPLVVEIVSGELDIEKVLQDVYWLSVLAWTKPDGVQREPVTIKLADDWLQPIAAEIDEDEGRFEPLGDHNGGYAD
jgi:hypothetical protein